MYMKDHADLNNSEPVDSSVDALLGVLDEYLHDTEITILILSSLIKLSMVGMHSRQEDIKAALCRVERSPDFLIHQISECKESPIQSS